MRCLVFFLVLAGCSAQEVIEERRELFVITDLNPPKHVYVDLKRVSDGKAFSHVYVSKHLNDWREYKLVGREISIVRKRIKQGESERDEFVGVLQAIKEFRK